MSSNANAAATAAVAAAALPKLPSDADIIQIQFEPECKRILKLGQQLKVHTTFGRSKLWQQLNDNCFGPEFVNTFHGVYQPWAKKQQAKNIKSRFYVILNHYANEECTRPIHEKARVLLAEATSAKEAYNREKENANEVQVARNAANNHQERNLGLLPQGHGVGLPSLPKSVTTQQRQQFENAAKVLAPNPVLREKNALNTTYPPVKEPSASASASSTATDLSVTSGSDNDEINSDDDDDDIITIVEDGGSTDISAPAPTANDKRNKKKGAATAGKMKSTAKRAKKTNNNNPAMGGVAVVANNVAPVAGGGDNALALVPAQHGAPAAAGGTVVRHAQGNQPVAGAGGGPARFIDEVDAEQMRRDRDVDNIDVIDSMNSGMFRAINLLCNSFGNGNAVPAPAPALMPAQHVPAPDPALVRHARMQAIMKTRESALSQGLQRIVDECDDELNKLQVLGECTIWIDESACSNCSCSVSLVIPNDRRRWISTSVYSIRLLVLIDDIRHILSNLHDK